MKIEGFLSKEFAISLFLIFLGAAFGIFAPDLDQRLLQVDNVIQHRSMVTHSFLLGWIFLWLSKQEKTQLFEFFAVGIFIGLAVHLSFDLFPKRWSGHALIYLPFVGNLRNIPFDGNLIPPLFSFLWMLGNLWLCLTFVWRILEKDPKKQIGAIGILLLVFLITSNTEQSFWLPLAVLLVCLWASFKRGAKGWKFFVQIILKWPHLK